MKDKDDLYDLFLAFLAQCHKMWDEYCLCKWLPPTTAPQYFINTSKIVTSKADLGNP
uniref:Uncharacterized protein n=1 Tax=Octopus bimaculoides TaxID=37653 RepID=A0A0L8HEF0_OCTBM